MDDEDKTDDESMMMPPPGKSPYKLGRRQTIKR